ncbi:hypothetical protein RMHFA_05737 (plasmid) [Roseomonas mucosa]|nr:hypothetical protein RMHFA_05737 [Roseomonas mucosa]
MLQNSLYVVQNRDELNFHADPGVAVREMPAPSGSPVNILLFRRRTHPAPSQSHTVLKCGH